MSLKSHSARKIALAGLAATAMIGASAASAQAATLKLTYSCTYPLIGAQPLTVTITATPPATAKVGTPTSTFSVKAAAAAGGSTYDGLKLIGASTIEGKATAGATIVAPQGTISKSVVATIAKYTVPATKTAVNLTATGTGPSVTFTKKGTATVSVTSLKLNLTAKKADGTAIVLGSTTDSDKNASTFDVPCKLSPTTQSTKLSSVTIS